MIPKGTVLEIGQKIHKLRKGGALLRYRMLEVIEKLNDDTYNCVDKNRRRKTVYVKVSKSEDLFVSKYDFLVYVANYIISKNADMSKYDRPHLAPESYIDNQVLNELQAHRKNSPEYWI